MEEQLNADIHTKSGKSLMNAFLRARTAFGFEYLISLRAEHSDADRNITGIEGLLFRNRLNRGDSSELRPGSLSIYSGGGLK